MLNEKQKSVLSQAAYRALQVGSGIEMSVRPLNAGEFAPIESSKKSGGLIFNKSLVPAEISKSISFSFLPVVDADGVESLGVFMVAGKSNNIVPIAVLNPFEAGSMIGDLMVSAAQYRDPELTANVVKAITDSVLASDLQVKTALVKNTEDALQRAFSEMVAKRLESKQAEFDAAIDAIERRAREKALKEVSTYMLDLVEIASTDRTSIRQSKLADIVPEIKSLLREVQIEND